MDSNNYYPFGLSHIGQEKGFLGCYLNYKFGGKELQETGMFDFGARFYMPDLGRWGVIDPLAETSRRFTPYNYAYNNPISFIDPDGRKAMNPDEERISFASGGALEYNLSRRPGSFSNFLGFDDPIDALNRNVKAGGGGNVTKNETGPGLLQKIGNFFKRILGRSKKGAGITTFAVGAQVSRIVQIGEIIQINAQMFYTSSGILATRSLWALPLILNGDSAHAPSVFDKPYNAAYDIPDEAVDDGPGENITLYRGVSSKIFHNDNSQYINAHFGIAIPKGYLQVNSLYGAHQDMEAHASGDNYSIWTSWSSDKEVARNFANGIAFGKAVPGIIMSKTFKVGIATPNPHTLGESEWLVPGVVYGAKVEYVLPRPGY